MIWLVTIISMILPGLLSNLFSPVINNLSYINMSFITLIPILTIYYLKQQNKQYYIYILILGIIYDLFYFNHMFISALLFLFISMITKCLFTKIKYNYITFMFLIILSLGIYSIIYYLLCSCVNHISFNFGDYFYYFRHIIVFNVIYSVLVSKLLINIKKGY